MADAERIVGRSIPCSEARAAKCRLKHGSRLHQCRRTAILNQFHINRHRCGIHTQRESVGTDIRSFQYIGCRTDIFKTAPCAAGDNPLIHIKSSVSHLIFQSKIYRAVQTHRRPFLHILQNIVQICIQFLYRISIARVERHGNHRFDAAQIHGNHSVVICHRTRIQFLIFFFSPMNIVKLFNLPVRSPDRRKAGSFRCHDINANAEIRTQGSHARSHKFHHLIFYIPVAKHRADNCQCHILRPDSLHRSPRHIYAHHSRHINIIRLIQKLLHQLRASLAHGHRTECPVAGMGIGTENHPSASGQHFPCILMNDCLMGRHIHPAVFFRTGKAEHVIVLIDGASHRTERIMAVRQHIRHRKLLQPGCPSRLNDAYKCNIMGSQFIKLNFQLFHIA